MLSRRTTPRRGRVIDPEYMDWARRQGCILRDKHRCRGAITFHHVRHFGSPKDDTHGLPLCAAAHLYDLGGHSIERMGKTLWQAHWCVDIEREIARLRAEYQQQAVRPADEKEEAE
jgi:hypothetical protein